ncbi:MAG: efflux RND transporter periplasmic adaptor subunit [Pirellulaceae bacterium]
MTTTSSCIADDRVETLVRRIDEAELPPRTEKHDPRQMTRVRRWRLLIVGVIAVASLSLVAAVASLRSETQRADGSYVYHMLRKSDLAITVTERGALESQNNVEILCEVDDVQGDGVDGTPILSIIENGVSVRKGDLLVELDTSSHLERLDKQILDTEMARAKDIQARVFYENRVTRNETALAKAVLDVQLAGLSLDQYEDEDGGTYQISVQGVELLIQEMEARKEIEDLNLQGMEHLFKLGYKSKGDRDEAKLKALKALSALEREKSKRVELTTYDYAKKRLTLMGQQATAKRALKQVEVENEALLAQAKAWKDSAELSLKREEERLARYREQLEKCKIYAPQDGMVAYFVNANHWGQSSSIAEGTAVHNQQQLMTIPDLTHMQVKTAVHESVVDQVKAGIAATIRLDAFPDRIYHGKVESVAVLPDPGGWLSSDTKVYQTTVTVNEDVSHLKPGMTAVVELHIDYLKDVLCVPAQAIVQRRDETWCYVADQGHLTQQPVKVGQTNDKFVEIVEGLQEGAQVVLNPASILDKEPTEERKIAPDAEQRDGAALD